MKHFRRRICLPFLNGLVILVLCGSCTLRAQKRQKQDIRVAYGEANSRIERCLDEGSPCGLFLNRIQTNSGEEPWAVVGIYASTRDLWYSRDDSSEEESFQLIKVNITTQRSARRENEEYLYSSGGQLLFYYFRMGEGDDPVQEFRFYFSDGQLVDYLEEVDETEQEYREWSKEDFAKVLEKAGDLQELLQATL
jgi:hypothetical protein